MKKEDFKILNEELGKVRKLLSILPGEALPEYDLTPLRTFAGEESGTDLALLLKGLISIEEERDGVSSHTLVKAYMSYLQVKILAEAERTTFDKKLLAALGRTYQEESEEICKRKPSLDPRSEGKGLPEDKKEALTAYKYEMLEKALEGELLALKERGIVPAEGSRVPDRFTGRGLIRQEVKRKRPVQEKNKKAEAARPQKAPVIFPLIGNKGKRRQDKKAEQQTDPSKITIRPKDAEAAYASVTGMEEVPFERRQIRFEKAYDCFLLPGYLLLMKGEKCFFGKKASVSGRCYDNTDGNLFELKKADPDFIQFMTQDLLGGEFILTCFMEEQKSALRNMFSFTSFVFSENMGKGLTINDYLSFQDYHNRLFVRMYEEEKRYRKKWHRCMEYAESIGLVLYSYEEDTEFEVTDCARSILNGETGRYREKLESILKSHGTSPGFNKRIEELIRSIETIEITGIPEDREEEKPERKEIFKAESDAVFAERYRDLLKETKKPVRYVVTKEDTGGQAKEEAVFSDANVFQAVYDFLFSESERTTIGIRVEGFETALFMAGKRSPIIPMVTDKSREGCKEILHLDRNLPDRYAELITDIMRKLMEEEK